MTDSQQYLYDQVASLVEIMRPAVQMHGGDIELVSVQEPIVYVRLTGACVGCPVSTYTMKAGIEHTIKEKLPCIQEVRRVED